jgi:hypothetical protein
MQLRNGKNTEEYHKYLMTIIDSLSEDYCPQSNYTYKKFDNIYDAVALYNQMNVCRQCGYKYSFDYIKLERYTYKNGKILEKPQHIDEKVYLSDNLYIQEAYYRVPVKIDGKVLYRQEIIYAKEGLPIKEVFKIFLDDMHENHPEYKYRTYSDKKKKKEGDFDKFWGELNNWEHHAEEDFKNKEAKILFIYM